MASSGPRYPVTTATLANAGTSENAEAWVTPGNIAADDASEATITASTYDSPDISQLLVASNFGFAIPAGATIDGIVVEIMRRNSAGAASDNRVQLAKGTTFASLVGSDYADTALDWPTTEALKSYGTGTTDMWGTTWTPAEINASSFAVFLSVQADGANTDIQVDYVRVTVYYTWTPLTSVADNFNGRTVSNGWGTTSDSLDDWVIAEGTASNFAVASGVATISVATASTMQIGLPNVGPVDSDVKVKVKVSALPSGSGIYLSTYLFARYADDNNYYRFVIVFTGTQIQLGVAKRVAGTPTDIVGATNIARETVAANQFFNVRAEIVGTTLRAKVWRDGTSEPGSWDMSTTDSAITALGTNPIRNYGEYTNGPITVTYEDYGVNSAAAATNANAGAAAGSGVGLLAAITLAIAGGLAAGSGTAYNATVATARNAAAGTATASGAAHNASVSLAPRAGSGAGVGTANNAATRPQDRFTRTESNGWGTADSGGAWSVHEGTATDFAVDGTRGTIVAATGAGKTIGLAVVRADSNTTIQVSTDRSPSDPTDPYQSTYVYARYTDSDNWYRLIFAYVDTGVVDLYLQKRVAGAPTQLDFETVPRETHVADRVFNIRFEVVGTTLRAKVWQDGTAEPGSWDISATDSSHASGSNPVGVGGQFANNSPTTWSFDNLNAAVNATNAAAGLAAGTGAAANPSIKVQPNAGSAAGSGAALNATAATARNAQAGVAAGSGTALGPSASVAPRAGAGVGSGTAYGPGVSTTDEAPADTATGTGQAYGASARVGATTGVAAGSGVALNATVATAVAAQAGSAEGSGTGLDATTAIAASASTATGSGEAHGVGVSTTDDAPAETATGSGTGLGAATAITVNAAVADATGAALDATITTARDALAGTAAGSGDAFGPSPSIAPVAGVAVGSGTASDAATSTTDDAPAETAEGSGTGHTASVSITTTAGEATGSGAADDARADIAPNAGAATATGSGLDATVATVPGREAPAETAAGTGDALGPSASVAPSAGTATGSGSAFDAAADTTSTSSANAGTAEGSGTGNDARASIAPTAQVAAGSGTALDATTATADDGPAETAEGSGTATDATVAISVGAATATGTGTAHDATTTSSAATDANAGCATGTGQAHNASISAGGLAAGGFLPGEHRPGRRAKLPFEPDVFLRPDVFIRTPTLGPFHSAYAETATGYGEAYDATVEWDDDETALLLLLEAG